MKKSNKILPKERRTELLSILKKRFEEHKKRHKDISWETILDRLDKNPDALWSLNEMEETGGEPDVIGYDKQNDRYLFADCSTESPKERRSICYDPEALESRKANKPRHSAIGMAEEMGVTIMNEAQYRSLQELGPFDTKTSSWIQTPDGVRELGGALFGDYRFGRVFIYHNGAESYYAARGFRAILEL